MLAVVGAIFVGSQAFRTAAGAYAVHVMAMNDAAFVKYGHVDDNAFHVSRISLHL